MRKRRTFALVGAGLAVLLAAAVSVGLLLSTGPSQGAPAHDPPGPSASSAGSARPVPAEVSEAISKLPSNVSGAVAADSPFRSRANSAIPSGSKTTAVADTWDQGSDTTGTVGVDFTPPGGRTTRHTALMLKEDGTWKVLATVEDEK